MPAAKEKNQIDARGAALAAANYFQKIYSDATAFSLEEIELSADEAYWLITLSFEYRPRSGTGWAASLQPPKTKYKVFKVDARTGKVISMKIRKLE